MTATFTEKRRTPPPRPLRELPVLFHLMDVSRPKGFAAPLPAFALETGGPAECDPAESFDLETAAELVQTKAYGSLPAEVPGPPLTAAAQVSAAPIDDLPSGEHDSLLSASATVEAGAATESSPEPSPEPALETPPAPADEAVSLRQRTEERQRKRQQDKKEDWFHSQGRYIAIGFVLALLATIYLARTNRKSPRPPLATKAKVVAPAATAAQGTVQKASSESTASITAVRPTERSPADEPKTALHPPTIPQLGQEPATTTAPKTDTLFSFSKSAEDRLAARTDAASTPTTSAPAPGTSPPLSTGPSDPPTLQPQYPSTNYPGNYQLGVPVSPTPVPATPAPTAPAGPATSPADATPLYPTTNSASGIRYERTGSSIY